MRSEIPLFPGSIHVLVMEYTVRTSCHEVSIICVLLSCGFQVRWLRSGSSSTMAVAIVLGVSVGKKRKEISLAEIFVDSPAEQQGSFV